MSEYYEILGLPMNATREEIRKKYKSLLKQYHPDNGMTADESKTKEINIAYKKIIDYLDKLEQTPISPKETVPNREQQKQAEEKFKKGILELIKPSLKRENQLYREIIVNKYVFNEKGVLDKIKDKIKPDKFSSTVFKKKIIDVLIEVMKVTKTIKGTLTTESIKELLSEQEYSDLSIGINCVLPYIDTLTEFITEAERAAVTNHQIFNPEDLFIDCNIFPEKKWEIIKQISDGWFKDERKAYIFFNQTVLLLGYLKGIEFSKDGRMNLFGDIKKARKQYIDANPKASEEEIDAYIQQQFHKEKSNGMKK